MAAFGFVIIALMCGALEPSFANYGYWILAGLVACALGDILLLSRNRPALFKFGMTAFALGHISYVAAFFTSSTFSYELIPFIVLLSISGFGFLFWLWKPLPKDMRAPVLVYTVIIITMTIVAAAMDKTTSGIVVVIPAVMFAVSDMFVAKDRFVSPRPINALAITPLYFGAQALFALSVQI